jgi:hypothetical protein
MSSDEFRLRTNPKFVASKRNRKKIRIEDPGKVHRELKLYLLSQRLVVERSALPERRKEAAKIDTYLAYLRTLNNE